MTVLSELIFLQGLSGLAFGAPYIRHPFGKLLDTQQLLLSDRS